MKKKTNLGYYVLIFFVVFLGIYFFTGNSEKIDYTEFSQCLTEKEVKMYGTDWCQFCQDQKGRFGRKAFKEIDYINCDFNQLECNQAGVQAYPTWKINDEIFQGVQPLESLASASGCELPI